jgi:putative tricarboxylic transport membrane protein
MSQTSGTPVGGLKTTDPLHKTDRSDLYSGIFFVAVSALGLFVSRSYHVGTATNMGEGYIPRLICWILLGIGLVIVARAFLRSTRSAIDPLKWRPIALVPLAIIVFGLTVESLGLIIAIPLLILIGSLAGHGLRPIEVVITAAILCLGSIAVFSWGLGLPIPVTPRF